MPSNTDIAAARAGDRAAFDRLVTPALPRLRRYAALTVGHPEDAEDVVQDALLKAWNGLGSFDEAAAFTTWLTAIVANTALDHLRARKRWRAGAQVAYANLCAADPGMAAPVMAAASDPEFGFEVREHIAYCFACVGRSLPPDEQAALVLRDVMDMSAREAASVLGLSDSVLRHRLSAARAAMQDRYEGLCALVSKQGICHQCAGLRQLAPEDKRGEPFPDIAQLADRMAVVRTAEPGAMRGLHAVFWRDTRTVEEQGLGTTEPQSDCGDPADAPAG